MKANGKAKHGVGGACPMSVYLIDGEDMIVAENEWNMKQIYQDYHGESIRGHDWRLIPPDEMIPLTNGAEEEWTESAAEFGRSRERYVPVYR